MLLLIFFKMIKRKVKCMAYLMPVKDEKEIKSLGVSAVRTYATKLSETYKKIMDGDFVYCHACNEFHPSNTFYNDKRYASGLYPICKKGLLEEATDYDKTNKVYIDNRDKTIKVFQKLDLPFIDSVYQSALQTTQEAAGEKNRSTAYQHSLVTIKSLPQYRGLTFENSEFGDLGNPDDEQLSKRKPRKEIIKLFGSGFSNEDYLYLQDQYDDWCSRTQVDSKSQQTYVAQICMQLLDIYKDRKSNKDVTKKLDALDKLMNAANLQPKQNVSNSANDSLTFGQLIEKWENEKPIPEPTEEFKDVDGIGKYIRVWFTGWLSKALGLRANVFTKEYDDEISKYTVVKPDADDENTSDEVYEQIFGTTGGE